MPGPLLHIVFLREVLRAKAVNQIIGGEVSPAILAIAQTGAIAPDMGYMPCCTQQISDAVHYVRTADFVRTLWESSEDDEARAFALGWATHWLLDNAVHPLINTAAASVGEETPKCADALTYYDDPYRHVLVEFAIELHEAAIFQDARDAPNYQLPRNLTFLLETFDRNYPNCFTHKALLSAIHALPFWARAEFNLATIQMPGALTCSSFAHHITRRVLRMCGRVAHLLAPNAAAAAFLAPGEPPQSILSRLPLLIPEAAELFGRLVQEKFRSISNTNLDTGQESVSSEEYPPAIAAQRFVSNCVRHIPRKGRRD